ATVVVDSKLPTLVRLVGVVTTFFFVGLCVSFCGSFLLLLLFVNSEVVIGSGGGIVVVLVAVELPSFAGIASLAAVAAAGCIPHNFSRRSLGIIESLMTDTFATHSAE